MAELHSQMPNHHGERILAQQLLQLGDPRLHLWFSLSNIPGVRDIDLVIWHEAAGVFVVEIKAVPLRMVEQFGYGVCHIEGRDKDESPQQQAYSGLMGLIQTFGARRLPFMTATACWPQISRDQWNRQWDDERVCGDFADKMLFEEDLPSPETLANRLRHIYRNPPVRSGSRWSFQHDATKLKTFVDLLVPEARPRPAKSDLERLETIERRVRRRVRKEAPSSQATTVHYTGRPGTGKTFRLLAIAFEHAIAGKRVLLSCFNKVLGADLRRLLDASPKLRSTDGEIRIRDVFEVAIDLNSALHLGVVENEHDDWGTSVLDAVRSFQGEIAKYDTLLIDEAQDMKAWQFDLLSCLAVPSATVCVAEGAGQELYGDRPGWLDEFSQGARHIGLRRTFRNTRPANQFAQAFYETALDVAGLETVVERFKTDGRNSDSFERNDGGWPQIHRFIEPALDWENQHLPEFPDAQDEGMTTEYERLIRQEVSRLKDDERPIDLLVLVPGPNASERRWAAAALTRLGQFTDYTIDDNRRTNASPDAIRLCTFHSARGLEGMRVLIFGVERMPHAVTQASGLKNLGYIALSRSLFETTIIVRAFDKEVAPFLSAAVDALRRHDKELAASAKIREVESDEAIEEPRDFLKSAEETRNNGSGNSASPSGSRETSEIARPTVQRRRRGDKDLVDRYTKFVTDKALNQRSRIEAIKTDWLHEFASAGEDARSRAAAVTKRTIRSPKLKQELAVVLAELTDPKN